MGNSNQTGDSATLTEPSVQSTARDISSARQLRRTSSTAHAHKHLYRIHPEHVEDSSKLTVTTCQPSSVEKDSCIQLPPDNQRRSKRAFSFSEKRIKASWLDQNSATHEQQSVKTHREKRHHQWFRHHDQPDYYSIYYQLNDKPFAIRRRESIKNEQGNQEKKKHPMIAFAEQDTTSKRDQIYV
ncbi:unnamed protein product [Didymodactylos carnosus]|uniref:Uncharacterized protein n=1 Tax=Didymodactylos carnosus TaxID=1234261 RepID=A0A815YTG9_9BILA|nr:unnamed protein product [Didymodactylos carnosus]CAF1574028.1 unnamed protein product [Didymodactylos carnosus]CAF4242380.1 unnamed protein product [Didymodactylos carnosus]CAF4438348.1 unnamed protein product [Didymodactylos carnosus]